MKKILFITGSLNQTSQMHQIAAQLGEFDCWFSQIFSDSPFINFLIRRTSLLNGTILAGQFKSNAEKYLKDNGLQIDYGAKLHRYDLVVYCSDLLIPRRMQQMPTIWVQEGMTDRFTIAAKIIKKLGLPAWLSGNTALNGSSNSCDIYCCASQGYADYFAANGAQKDKLIVTGIPNYDDLEKFRNNDFPYHDYVMVATTDMRETFRYENRAAFIKHTVKVASGRRLLFKLHPNENAKRAKAEIEKYAPNGTLIFDSGNTNEMIANCSELITQYSTVVYTGIALGKKVHSWFNINELKQRVPVQNKGMAAANIAAICREHIHGNRSLAVIQPSATNVNIVIVVQARMSSSRLPGKVMMPVKGKSLLAMMTDRLQQTRYKTTLVIATSLATEDDVIEEEANALQIACYRGSLDNLLDRHYQAAKLLNADVVLKIPSDCPLIDPAVIDTALDHFFAPGTGYDYVSNLHPATWPDGNDVEIMTMNCLEKTWQQASRPLELEHTTPYIWENPDKFNIANISWETGLDYSMSHRFTIDYLEDYLFITRVYDELYDANSHFTCRDIIKLLVEKPEIYHINQIYAGVNWYRNHLTELKTITPGQTKQLLTSHIYE